MRIQRNKGSKDEYECRVNHAKKRAGEPFDPRLVYGCAHRSRVSIIEYYVEIITPNTALGFCLAENDDSSRFERVSGKALADHGGFHGQEAQRRPRIHSAPSSFELKALDWSLNARQE